MSELKDLLAVADRVAAEASAALIAHRREWGVIAEEQGREVKIDADKRAEEIILKRLDEASSFSVISEEAGWVRAAQRGERYVWAVDPLDGSINYLRDYPHCAVSIGLLDNGRPVLGVVDCFVLGERFTGLVGHGAWLNGKPIHVSDIDGRDRAILMTGIPSRAFITPQSMDALKENIFRFRKVRMIGSAACALATVAAGRAEVYRESGSMIWDVAGGCALVAAAGGKIALEGELSSPLEVYASNGAIADD